MVYLLQDSQKVIIVFDFVMFDLLNYKNEAQSSIRLFTMMFIYFYTSLFLLTMFQIFKKHTFNID